MNMKKIISLLLVLIMALSFVSFAEEDEEVGLVITLGGANRVEGDEPTHLTVCNSTKVNGSFFSRQFGNNTSDIDVRAMLHGYNPIVWDTQLTFVLDPMVVDHMDKSTDKNGDTVYTFYLCDDLTWNDGTPMDAKDWVFALVMENSPEFEAISGDTDVWEHLVGHDEFVTGESSVLSGVRLLGKYTYSVTVKKEYLPYFYELSYLYVMPAPISVIAPGCEVADDGEGAYIRNIDQDAAPIYSDKLLRKTILNSENGYLSYPMLTCGPYNLVSYNPKSGTVEFTINEYYKGDYKGQKPTITDITLIPALPQDMAAMLENGEVDLINKAVDASTINDCIALAEGDFDFENYPRLGYGFIGASCEKGPMQYQAVRQAIMYAFDTDDFDNKLLETYGMPVYGFYGIGQWMTQAAMGVLRPTGLSEEEKAAWDAITLDNLNHYDYNPEKSVELLEEDGWIYNDKGGEFDPEFNSVRYKLVDGKYEPLKLTFAVIKDNIAAHDVCDRLLKELTPMGFDITVHETEFTDLLIDYLREEGDRKYDIEFLAHNFVSIFDPLVELGADPTAPGTQNATGIYDEEMVKRAWDMHHTEPGDLLGYLTKWVSFQERFNEILPTLPLYSDIYYDFHISALKNYMPDAEANWPRAILYAYLVDEEVEAEEGFLDEEDEGDGEDWGGFLF